MKLLNVVERAPGEMTKDEQSALSSLLAEVGDEFVPPLTGRGGTTQVVLNGGGKSTSNSYYEEMLLQSNMLAFVDDRLIAFVSFRAAHFDERLPQVGTCLYISTIAVSPSERGRGYARKMYERIIDLPKSFPAWVVLRTWSTNAAHLHLLDTLGFANLLTIPNDRGNGIDTVYVGLKRY